MSHLAARLANLSAAKRKLFEQAAAKLQLRPRIYPLSYAQLRLWFIHQLDPSSTLYNMPCAVRMAGYLDREALLYALREVVRRHEILRTRFVATETEPIQQVECEDALPIEVINVNADSRPGNEGELERIIRSETQHRFDLTRGPLLRVKLLQVREDEHMLLVTMHHIVSDGWSMGILIREVAALYEGYRVGKSDLGNLKAQYGDYAVWQRESLKGTVLERQIEYWRKQLDGLERLELPRDAELCEGGERERAGEEERGRRSEAGETVGWRLEKELSEKLRELSRHEGVTLFMMLLGAWTVLLERYSGQEDIAVGTPIAGRMRVETEALIGFFVNTLVLRNRIEGGRSFAEWLRKVRETTLEAYAHQEVPFEKVVEVMQPERRLGQTPLFQVMFVLQNVPKTDLQISGLKISGIETSLGVEQFELTMTAKEAEGVIGGGLSYRKTLFTQASVQRLLCHWETLLREIVQNPQNKIYEFILLGRTERQQIVVEWNQTQGKSPVGETILELLEEQARNTPENPAVIFEGESTSYRKLHQQANQLAHFLRKLSVGPEVPVGVCMKRSAQLVTVLLGIMKAGGAYVPLDPSYPGERLSYMLGDSRLAVVLVEKEEKQKLADLDGVTCVCLEEAWPLIDKEGQETPENNICGENLAYVIYTSGSTGQPKGVMNVHRGLLNRLQWMQAIYRLGKCDRVLQKTPFGFDVSVWEFFWPLMYGAELVVALPEGHKDSAYLARTIQEQQITTMHFVPSMLAAFLQESGLKDCKSLRRVISSGEALSPALVESFYRYLDAELHNLYGPTEASIDVSCWACERQRSNGRQRIPIGRPITNTQLYILSAGMQPVPVGVMGELYIGGIGLARGYRGNAELTAEKFVPDPFSGRTGERLYRSGDRVRWLPDGNIEFLGRKDRQVKVRGFRIELGEIEKNLEQHPEVKQAIAVVRHASAAAEMRLIAYVVGTTKSMVDGDQLKTFLRSKMPEQMVPGIIMQLESLPLTLNGKLDLKRLPDPQECVTDRKYAAPRSLEEEILCGLWEDVLKRDRVGIHDNFFDLGGHSLLATQLMSRIRCAFSVELPLRLLFDMPTVSGLAEQLKQRRQSGLGRAFPMLKRVNREGPLPSSFAQQRLWFIHRLEPESNAYNMPIAVRLRGELRVEVMEQAFRELVRRHEVLRTHFQEVNGEPQQIIAAEMPFFIPLSDLSMLTIEERDSIARQLVGEEAEKTFTLEHGPLIRARIFRLCNSEHILLVTMHHIICDGWSLPIMVREIAVLYQSYCQGLPSPFADLAIQYADYAVWQREWLQGEVLEEHLQYWRRQLNAVSALQLPTASSSEMLGDHQGVILEWELSQELTHQLKKLSRREGATMFMSLLTCFQIWLSRYCGQQDIAIGTPIAGRQYREVEEMIGFFVNTLVLRATVDEDLSFLDMLRRVRSVVLEAYDHQDVPFEKIVGDLQPQRYSDRSPLFEVMMVLQNGPSSTVHELPGLEITPIESGFVSAKQHLSLYLADDGNCLKGSFVFREGFLSKQTGCDLLNGFTSLIRSICSDAENSISRLPVFDGGKVEHILADFVQDLD